MAVNRMQYFIFRMIVFFSVLSALAAAQTGTVEFFLPGTVHPYGAEEYRGAHLRVHPQIHNFRGMNPDFPSERSHDAIPDFSLEIHPAKELDTELHPDKDISHFGGNHAYAFKLESYEDDNISNRNDLLHNEDKGLGAKLFRASLITHSAQVANLMLMIQFPDHFTHSISSWAEAKSNLKRAWTNAPVWDKDPWTTNFIGHPYVGAFYYNMMRSQGSSARTSFLYATGQSVLWEYMIESVVEQPSIQDLLFTSTIGSLIGEAAHRATLRLNRNGFSLFEKVLVTFINPSYILNNGYKKHHRTPVPHY